MPPGVGEPPTHQETDAFDAPGNGRVQRATTLFPSGRIFVVQLSARGVDVRSAFQSNRHCLS